MFQLWTPPNNGYPILSSVLQVVDVRQFLVLRATMPALGRQAYPRKYESHNVTRQSSFRRSGMDMYGIIV